MGIYLNPGADAFRESLNSRIYIDKTGLIGELNQVICTEQKYVCVSRPRRFGKSMAANMICAYYDRTVDPTVFHDLKIETDVPDGMAQQGKYNVIRINMQEFLSRTDSVGALVERLQKRVAREILREYPDVDYFDAEQLTDVMEDLYAQSSVRFVIVIDEWDCIFREYPHDTMEQNRYLDFLRDWLKDKTYLALVYMTGILPIKKYGTHSALNMFTEYSMEHPGKLSQFVGFTDEEVRGLCEEFSMDYDDCRYWYNGYRFPDCPHIYSPKSIVSAMLDGSYHDYWNRTETYEALKIYIDMNFDGLKDKLLSLMAGDQSPVDPGHFQNDMTSLTSADDVLTLLIHLGYLGYDEPRHSVFIPNHEIQIEFVRAMDDPKWDEVQTAVRTSAELLKDTWNCDAEAVAAGIEKAHLETSHLQYNDENALSYTVSLAYYAARQYYTCIRELPAGKGFADVTFIPRRKYSADKPAMIIELKWDDSAETAIRQIHERNYAGALKDYQGKLLLVGISYDKKSRKHHCIIEQI